MSSRQRGSSAFVADERTLALEPPAALVRPIDPPEVWCAGVTYERSRDARIEESGSDVYALVYDADRPELFLKDAQCRRTVGPGEPIAIRSDAAWNVPEPEIGVVLGDDLDDRRLHDRERRLVPRHRGREPALPPAGEGVRRAHARSARRSTCPTTGMPRSTIELTIRDADGSELFAGVDIDRDDEANVPGARRLARARQPGSRG